MKKEEYQELMYLSIYGELTDDEQALLDAYLKKYPEQKKEFEQVRKFGAFVSDNTSSNTAEVLLPEARTQLRSALRKERNGKTIFGKIVNDIGTFFQPKLALGGIGALSLGLLIGYCSFSPSITEQGLVFQPVKNETSAPEETRIDNIRFIDADASDGEIEFEFEAVAPMRLKGKVDDPEIQKVLTHALLNESNAGIRLKTMNAIALRTDEKRAADPVIKSALISSLKNDGNPGVRREALRVLQQFEFDNEIRDAVLQVLIHDANSGIRVAAINALEIAKLDGEKFDSSVATLLKQQIKTEQNSYIRNRAATLVKEIYQ
jgi:hypothetical protein